MNSPESSQIGENTNRQFKSNNMKILSTKNILMIF